jgi:hypothetical protein
MNRVSGARAGCFSFSYAASNNVPADQLGSYARFGSAYLPDFAAAGKVAGQPDHDEASPSPGCAHVDLDGRLINAITPGRALARS